MIFFTVTQLKHVKSDLHVHWKRRPSVKKPYSMMLFRINVTITKFYVAMKKIHQDPNHAASFSCVNGLYCIANGRVSTKNIQKFLSGVHSCMLDHRFSTRAVSLSRTRWRLPRGSELVLSGKGGRKADFA